jgi:prepilin-type N-terminal cleavage/methylation domain-containing protein
MSHQRNPRRGGTMIELVLTMALLGVVMSVAVPSLRTIVDRMNVRAARQDVVLALWAARNAATMRGDFASFVAEAATGRVRVVSGRDTVFARDLARRGVAVAVTRDSITYAPTGIGWGAANTRIIVSRGRRADTVTTSRLGRVAF